MNWIEENYKDGLLNFRIGLKKKLFSGKSPFQTVEVFESEQHGRVLLNDGAFMLCERDERIYHEMMAHVPLSCHRQPRRVLIIGGGDGGTAREVLRHSTVERCVMVEIDRMVVDACREFIPQTASAFSDPRLELQIADGVDYMKTTVESFDVILIDSTDPNGAAQPLFGFEFYQDVATRLAPGGVVVAQGESVFYDQQMQTTLLQITHGLFAQCALFNFTNMTYPGGLWSMLWASNEVQPLKDLKSLPATLPMHYYNESVHRAAFQLPEFQRRAVAPWTKLR